MLEVKNLTKYYGENRILKELNLQVSQGEVVQILGQSGAGKTTFLRCISGLETFKSGSILINSQLVQSEKVFIPPSQRRIGMVFQDLSLWPHLTVWQNIDFASSSVIKNKSERQNWNDVLLMQFKIDHKKDKYPGELSGGEQQRCALARAFANRPQIILLDEPVSNLDNQLTEDVILALSKIRTSNNISIIIATHEKSKFSFFDSKNYLISSGVIKLL